MDVIRIAAFSRDGRGGNPAGVVLADRLPAASDMLRIAARVGYSETAFAAPEGSGWRVRYFAPETEVPFCGHATIATGAALGARYGEGRYDLILGTARITVVARRRNDGTWGAALHSPPTRSEPASGELVDATLSLFGWSESDLDPRLPVSLAEAGARHVIVGLRRHQTLAAMRYSFAAGKALMTEHKLITVCLVWAESERRFHARNPFAIGGVYEDPATGAAAAALGGYLRDIGWMAGGKVDIFQGEDMGAPSHIQISVGTTRGEAITVAGATYVIEV